MNRHVFTLMRQRLQIFAQVTQTPAYDEFRMIVTCAGILLFLVTALMVRTFSLQPDEVLAGIDIHHAFLGWYEFARQSLAEGYLPLWDPYQANGYPFLHNPKNEIEQAITGNLCRCTGYYKIVQAIEDAQSMAEVKHG